MLKFNSGQNMVKSIEVTFPNIIRYYDFIYSIQMSLNILNTCQSEEVQCN